MPKSARGFTLIELMVVVAVLAIIASIMLTSIGAARVAANEAAAIQTLKCIHSAQSAVIGAGAIDSDGNGRGEFGYLSELSGTSNMRTAAGGSGRSTGPGPERIATPILPASYRISADGTLQRSAYHFQIYLPGLALQFVPERVEPGTHQPTLRNVASVAAENYFACYAWPASYGHTGRRAFFLNQIGQILMTPNTQTRYSGVQHAPLPGAALQKGQGLARMQHRLAINATGNDDNRWTTLH